MLVPSHPLPPHLIHAPVLPRVCVHVPGAPCLALLQAWNKAAARLSSASLLGAYCAGRRRFAPLCPYGPDASKHASATVPLLCASAPTPPLLHSCLCLHLCLGPLLTLHAVLCATALTPCSVPLPARRALCHCSIHLGSPPRPLILLFVQWSSLLISYVICIISTVMLMLVSAAATTAYIL